MGQTTENNYIFEILAIDKDGATNISTAKSLAQGLSYNEMLWNKPEIKKIDELKTIEDSDKKIKVLFQPIDTSSVLNDLIESAFIIQINGSHFEELEKFRYNFLLHLRKLSFKNIRILRDDISTKISNDIYPLINEVENLLRRYLVKFFTQKIGIDWWEITAPKKVSEKLSMRKDNEKVFSKIVDTDVTLIDFDDLGELIYKQTTGFNKQEDLRDRVMNSETAEDLASLKKELQGNYTKYFKEAFQNNNFETKWKELFSIRNKVAHNNLFTILDYQRADTLVDELKKIINSAEEKIDEFKFSIQEQEALRKATIEAVKEAEIQQDSTGRALDEYGIHVIDKIDLEDIDKQKNAFKIISEDKLIAELKTAEENLVSNRLSYLGLKVFVTKMLGSKGYSYGPTYSLINILKEKGIVDIYDVDDDLSFYPIKGIRLNT